MGPLDDRVAILSDLDGVLVDSHAAIERGYDEWADGHGLDRRLVRSLFPGTPARQVVEQAAPDLDADAEAKRIDGIHLDHGGEVEALPGAAALLADPPLPLAVVTSCSRPLAAARFDATGLTPPTVVVTADDVAVGKPDPAAYLAAARQLDVEPSRCLVIEDAPAGVQAGKAAGMTVLALTTTHPEDALVGADFFALNLSAAARDVQGRYPAMVLMATVDPDAHLLVSLVEGDREQAMSELYDRYARRIHGLGMRLLRDGALAEELVQETFVRLWRSANRFDPAQGSGRGYLFTLARRAAIDMHRRRPEPTAPIPELDDGDSARYDQLIEELTLRDALASLPQHHREVLELAYFEDLTQERIGIRLGVPEGTVKSRTYHALRSLRGVLGAREAA